MPYRDDRAWPDVYFGRPGALTTLPYPRDGIQPVYERPTFDFVTGSGGHRVSKLTGGSRVWQLNWRAMGGDTYGKLERYDQGHNGVGPWALIDPSRMNLLTANQSSATGLRRDTQGFSTSASNHGSVFSNSNATHIHRAGADRSLEWRFTVAPFTSPRVELDTVWSPWFGVPTVPGRSYVWSCWVKPDGVIDASIDVEAKIQWRNTAGATVGAESTGGVQTVTGWTRLICIATAPVGSAFGSVRLVGVGATITTGSSLYVDEMQFEDGTAVTDWVPGTGVNPVETLGLSGDVPWAATWRTGVTMTVREVNV